MKHPSWYGGTRQRAHAPMPTFSVLALVAALIAGPVPALAGGRVPSDEATAKMGRSFTLVDQDGRTVTDAQFRGKWMLVYFGYTHCPDTCPTALNTMAEALDRLGPAKRHKVQAIFITVDPERDTPAVMKDYVGAFEGSDILGLTGTPNQVSAAEEAYQFRAVRFKHVDGDYAMSHSSKVHIMDPDGHFAAMAYPEHITEHLVRLVP